MKVIIDVKNYKTQEWSTLVSNDDHLPDDWFCFTLEGKEYCIRKEELIQLAKTFIPFPKLDIK